MTWTPVFFSLSELITQEAGSNLQGTKLSFDGIVEMQFFVSLVRR